MTYTTAQLKGMINALTEERDKVKQDYAESLDAERKEELGRTMEALQDDVDNMLAELERRIFS